MRSHNLLKRHCNTQPSKGELFYKGEKFNRESVLNIRIHFKLTETFQYTLYSTCHPPGVKKRFAKGEALLLLRTSKQKFVRDTTG